MSHYLTGVVIHPHDDTRDAVEKALERFQEGYGGVYAVEQLWDWYVIGGRWNGEWSDDNRVTVSHLLDDGLPLPFHLILPDSGVLSHERWDGKTFIETTEWERVAREALEPYRSAHIVAVDVHS